jgi:phage baseplate assembly protein gpV
MTRLGVLMLGTLLVGCADGGGGPRPMTIEWERSPYEAGSADRSVDAVVELVGNTWPPDAAIEVRAVQGGVVVETPSKRIDGPGRIPVRLRAEADASGGYVLVATIVVDGVVHSATTMLVVPY